MLLNLIIENFVLLDKLELDFSKGLCVMTGETGAGKSLVVDAIEGVIGGKLSPDQIKMNAPSAYLEATFDITGNVSKILHENGFDDIDATVTLSRTIHKSGSRFRINGQLATQNLVRQIGENLIDIIGQHENQYLFKADKHRLILDLLGNDNHRVLIDNVRKTHNKLINLKKEYEELESSYKENKRQLDFYNFQLNEIEEADPKPGEDDELKQQREILVHAEELIENLNEAYFELYGSDEGPSISDRLNSVSRLVERCSRVDPTLESVSTELEGVISQLKDISAILRDHSESVDSDPEQLSEIEERLNLLLSLKNKYGPGIEDILNFRDELREKLKSINFSSGRMAELKKEIAVLETDYKTEAALLSSSRKDIAAALEPATERELSDLGMEKTKFKVNIVSNELLFSDNGFDSVEFLISPNPGEPLRPLAKTASGGEISRIMLSLKMVLHKTSQVPSLIFDEIDTGISGKAALVVSQKLAKLARFSQIICITHLPVVAAMAEQHLWIEKSSTDENTRVDITALNENLRIEKLAQMTGAKMSTSSLKHAKDIYKSAIDFKKSDLVKAQ